MAAAGTGQPAAHPDGRPFGALDAQTRAKMQAHLLEIWRNIDITILFITHDLDRRCTWPIAILVLKGPPGRGRSSSRCPCRGRAARCSSTAPEFRATKAHIEALIHPPAAHRRRRPGARWCPRSSG